MHLFLQHLHRLWLAPDLGLVHQRRERRMRLLTSLVMVVMGWVWGIFFALRGFWLIVAMDLVLTVAGLGVFALTWRHKIRSANIVLFPVLLLIVVGIAALMDVPSAQAPRSTHLYLLPLSMGALMAFRDEAPWLRYGIALACLLAFMVLASTTAPLVPGYNLPDDVRVVGTWMQTGAALLMFFGLLHVMQTDATERTELESELLQALAQQQFVLHYQPQLDGAGKVIGAEALLRWEHPKRGLLLPGQFIELAEDTGLIVPLGQWVLGRACAQLQSWAAHPGLRDLCLAVNISQKQFRQGDFVPMVLALIERYQVDARRLELELTETMLVQDVDEINAKMASLVARGVTFSLDDFGTGYSSLSYLKRLPLHKLKIDQSFVMDLLTDPHSETIVRTVIALGQSLGLTVIAEGVETQGQRQFLLDNGCPQFQGFLLSRPLPPHAFEAFVQTQNA